MHPRLRRAATNTEIDYDDLLSRMSQLNALCDSPHIEDSDVKRILKLELNRLADESVKVFATMLGEIAECARKEASK